MTNKLLGLINLSVSIAGIYMIGQFVYMHSLYYTDFNIFNIMMIVFMLIILAGVMLNAVGYLTDFEKSNYSNPYILVIGIVIFVGVSYSWTNEIKESEYGEIKKFYQDIKHNSEVEKLFTTKFKQFKKDNIITRSEYFELERIYKYSFYLKNKSTKIPTRNLTLE